ncbi:MAG: hypothetical protein LBL41_03105 [Bifidobacteriaceae bacterium]|nr:hypothetical protein [Bifidobacteriaceae bacterium]
METGNGSNTADERRYCQDNSAAYSRCVGGGNSDTPNPNTTAIIPATKSTNTRRADKVLVTIPTPTCSVSPNVETADLSFASIVSSATVSAKKVSRGSTNLSGGSAISETGMTSITFHNLLDGVTYTFNVTQALNGLSKNSNCSGTTDLRLPWWYKSDSGNGSEKRDLDDTIGDSDDTSQTSMPKNELFIGAHGNCSPSGWSAQDPWNNIKSHANLRSRISGSGTFAKYGAGISCGHFAGSVIVRDTTRAKYVRVAGGLVFGPQGNAAAATGTSTWKSLGWQSTSSNKEFSWAAAYNSPSWKSSINKTWSTVKSAVGANAATNTYSYCKTYNKDGKCTATATAHYDWGGSLTTPSNDKAMLACMKAELSLTKSRSSRASENLNLTVAIYCASTKALNQPTVANVIKEDPKYIDFEKYSFTTDNDVKVFFGSAVYK